MPYPPSLRRLKATGTIILHHPCHACGEPASFGRDVELQLVFKALEAGQKPNRDWLGIWTCGPDACRKAGV